MRFPNGYGSVVKLSGNRRRPYMARITVGYKDNGQAIYKALDYFAKREDALVALAKYNDEPFSLDHRNATLEELFELFKEEKMPGLSKALASSLKASYKHVSSLKARPYRSIKAYQMQRCIDNCGLSYATQTNIRNLFFHLDRFAFELDIISKRNSETLKVSTATPKERTVWTDAEVQALWKRRGEPAVDETLFMLYTGMRVSEMMSVKCKDVHLEEGYLTGGLKTAAGKDRVIPIHDELRPVIEKHLSGEYLFKDAQTVKGAVETYRARLAKLGTGHVPHECRHTFRTKLDGQNKVCIDLIMGHKSQDVGERVYTHKTLDELKETIKALNYKQQASNK